MNSAETHDGPQDRLPRKKGEHRRRVAALLVAFIALVGSVGMPAAAQAAVGPLTVVSLTFDDGNANQKTAAATLAQYKLRGTFFVNSGVIGTPNYLTRSDLTAIAAAGNEIGGHSVGHPDLTTVSTDEATRQVCNDRVALTNWGFQVRSFAYPYANSTPATEAIVANCGYNSARMLGDISSRFGCAGCPLAETMPPENPYYTKALDQVQSNWRLRDLQNAVTNAERAGGWVQFTFHQVCSNCGSLGISPTVLNQFAAWLAPRATTGNTQVRTVGEVIGGPVKPVVSGPATVPTTGGNLVKNPSLESTAATGLPTCWMKGGYGTNTATFATATPARTGTKAESVRVTNYVNGDAKLLPTFDLGDCSPSVTAGRTYSLRSWYKSTAVTQFAVYLRNSAGGWAYWTSSPWFPAATNFTQAVWTTPAIPSGMTGISFGLNIFANGTIVTDDYSAYDTVGAPAP